MTHDNEILEYWFEGITDRATIDQRALPFRKWFTKDKQLDREIKEKFAADLLQARQGQHKNWEKSRRGLLALIILFDQFSRHMYRNTAKMFENDSLALDLSLRSINEKLEDQLQLIERMFFYMPLMHCEALDIQKISLQCFEQLLSEAKQKHPQNAAYYEYNFHYAQKHYAVIEKFGRFPHRNIFFNRVSSLEELEFLRKGQASF